MKFSHENLKIWRDQLVRAVEAVPRDIAEGYGKSSRKERALYIERAKSAVAETDTSFKEAVKKRRILQEKYENLVKPLIKELYFKIIGYRKWLLEDATKASADSPSQPSPPRRQPIPHLNQAQRSTTGFTLIEMLVVIGVLAIVGSMTVSLFFQTLKGASKTEILKEVKQNGDYALGVMERMIRNSRTVPVTCTGASSNSLTITNPDNGQTTFSCALEDSVYKIASGSAKLTGKNVTLGNPCTLSFVCTQTGQLPRVEISFTLYQAGSPTRPEEKAQVSFKTTVSLRTYK